MALFHLSVTQTKRSAGQSAIASAAYRAGERSYKNSFLDGRYKTWGRNGYYCFDGLPIVQIGWANWDSGLIFGKKGIVARRNPYN